MFTCIRCTADTWNDCDLCDDCIAESMKDYEPEAPAPIPHQQTSGSEIPNNCPQNTTQEKT